MRNLILFADVTVDGFMAGPDNDLDFMAGDEELAAELIAELMQAADTIVIGRKAFNDMAEFWPVADNPYAAWMNSTPKVVLSNSLTDASSWENSTIASGEGVDEVKRLKRLPGRSLVVFGGVETVRRLVGAGMVDEYWLKVNPAAVGRGGPVFADLPSPVALRLRSARSFPTGTVAAIYTNATDD